MHEMAICESIMQVMEDQAKQQDFQHVSALRLEIGPFAGVELEALRFSFDVVTRGTLAEGCQLEVIETEARAWCLPCAKDFHVDERFDPCPDCGSYQMQVTAGEELRIKDMEVN